MNNQLVGVFCEMEKESNKVHILFYKKVEISNKIRTHKNKQKAFSSLTQDQYKRFVSFSEASPLS